ncbi:MAG: pitrilysin family protein [Leptolyngbyaceae cyanobacterium MO_188.B28]|nr:pitrilysin family protein [Leptolyngbyaceae cyanobacterium MO_188.B28]
MLSASTAASLNFADYMPEIVDYILPNGLRVILAKDDSAPVVAVSIWYRVGAADDPDHRSGFAHLFEHLMFDGSENVERGEHFRYLNAIGAGVNASTQLDYTNYFEILPANQLPLALWLESDRMASLNVTQEGFDIQRQVVIQEFNQRVLNQPYGRTYYLHLSTDPFLGYPPYERSPIGIIEDLNAATLEDVKTFHRQYYAPNNATLVIAGNIDFEQTQALVQAYFGGIPAGDPGVPILERCPLPVQFPVTRTDPETGCKIGHEVTLVDPLIELPQVFYSVVAPARGDRDFYALRLLARILSGGKSSRFQQALVLPGLASSADAWIDENVGASLFVVDGKPNASEPIESVQSLLQDQLRQVVTEGVTEAELARVKTQQKIAAISRFRGSVLSTAMMLQQTTLLFGEPQALIQDMAGFDAVTPEDIQQLAQTYLCNAPMNRLITLKSGNQELASYPGLLAPPSDIGMAPQPLEVDMVNSAPLVVLPEGVVSRTQPPSPLPVTEINLPSYQTFNLSNGLPVIFVEQHKIPKLQLTLHVGGSNAAAPENQQGIANLLADVITQGAAQTSATELAEQIESLGGSLNAHAGREFITLSSETPSPNAQVAFDVLADMVLNSAFPQSAFEAAQSQHLITLAEAETNPQILAARQFRRVAYPHHPYGFSASIKTVQPLTRDDLAAFHNTFFKPNNALLVIVGDITLADAQVETERVLGDWPSGEVPDFLAYPLLQMGNASAIYLIDRPKSEQSTIRVGNLSLSARSPDRYPLLVMNTILGGGPSSRLFLNLREDKGYTYGAYSRVDFSANDTGVFVVRTDVGAQYTGAAVQEILQELQAIRTQLPLNSELSAAKGLLLGRFDRGLEHPANFAEQLANLRLTGVPLEALQQYRAEIGQVTADDVLQSAAQYVSEQPIIVVVGDASVVKPQLEQLGQVVRRDGEGNVSR